MILDTLQFKNNGLAERNTGENPSLLDDTEEKNCIKSPFGDITQLSVNKKPVSAIRKNIHPEVINSMHIYVLIT
jgi:hypothetical protein